MSRLPGRLLQVVIAVAWAQACTPQTGGDDEPAAVQAAGGARAQGGRGGTTGMTSGGMGGTTMGSGGGGAASATGGAKGAPPTGGNSEDAPRSSTASDGGTSAAMTPDALTVPLGVLPVVWIDVPGKTPETLPQPNAEKVNGTFKVIEDHDGTHNNIELRPPSLMVPIGITLRGSSSSGFAQKSFSVEFRDAAGQERKLSTLGMPANADWAVVACWTDKTCMRNALAYSIGQRFGRWNPRFRFVEVFFNKQYLGLYQFIEPPRADKTRVPIPKPTADMTAGDAFTGGYIIRREAGGKGSTSEGGKSYPRDWLSKTTAPGTYPHQVYYTYHYPKETVITAAQKTYIQGHIANFETMMKADDFAKNYPTWIDTTSWADFTIVNELTNNVDGYWKSFYVAKLPDEAGVRGKMLATPIWDFNLGFGNADYREGWKTDVMNLKVLTTFGGECAGPVPQGPPMCDGVCCQADKTKNTCKTKCWTMPIVPFYWERLRADPAFQNSLKCRWKDLRKKGEGLDMAVIDASIADWKAQLEKFAIPRHFAKWAELQKYTWPNPYVVDPSSAPVAGASVQQFFDKEVKWFRDWVEKRAKWMDANLPGTCAN